MKAPTSARWIAISAIVLIPFALAAISPLLQWRSPIYIAAGFAGILGLGLLLIQPLLIGTTLLGKNPRTTRHIHRWIGLAILLTVLIHVIGLWITSPPDVIDALLFRSPTSFSAWGVIALWAVLVTALLAGLKKRLPMRAKVWGRLHLTLTTIIAIGTIIHALQIEGTMELWSKWLLCALVAIALAKLIFNRMVANRNGS